MATNGEVALLMLAAASDAVTGIRRPLQLTARGQACTRAADECAVEVVRAWQGRVGARGVATLRTLLRELDLAGPIRPAW